MRKRRPGGVRWGLGRRPLLKRRNSFRRHQNRGLVCTPGGAWRVPVYWPGGVRCGGGVSPVCCSRAEREKACSDTAAVQPAPVLTSSTAEFPPPPRHSLSPRAEPQQCRNTPSHVPHESSRLGSRHLHTGHHLASRRAPARLL